jgi:endoglucanase
MTDRTDPLSIARTLLAVPTAPFHEGRVMTAITTMLDDWGISYTFDRHGNLIAHYSKGRGPRWALVAHTDHPGIDITSRRGRTVKAAFLGGVKPNLLPGAKVRLYGPNNAEAGGQITAQTMSRGEKRVTITLNDDAHGIGPGCFGSFDLGPPKVGKERIAVNAADDLAGCATTLSVLAEMKHSNLPGRVYGVFTRAEEVGFAGAQALADDRTLPNDALVVSLECSMEMAGARQGKGPVIRVGDRATTFNSTLEYHLHQAATQLQKTDPGFKFQRQLMTGGSCEGTVFTTQGYRTIGLAYPLRNYHNMVAGDAAGEYIGIDQEEIVTADYLGGVKLLLAAIASGPKLNRGQQQYYRRLQRATARYRKRL